ncbi:MAG: ABC transporter permease [Sphingobium sp.]|nr:ABC transporter permease [Sphingobium sp.]MCP5400050.1 ABC transporter permease [Sphingomonas sp.]
MDAAGEQRSAEAQLEPDRKGKSGWSAIEFFNRYGTGIFLVLVCAFFMAQNPNFLSLRNIANILTDVSIYGVIAVGMTFVIITAGVDLAVGATLAFASMFAAWLISKAGVSFGPPWLTALLASVAVGAIVGYIHGKATTFFNVPAFITTLGGMTIWRGASMLINDGGPISGFDEGLRWWGTGAILGVPVPVVVFVLVAAAGYIVQRYTRFGRQIYAIGGNVEAARLTGLNVKAVETSVYMIVGLLSGLAGFLLMARLNSAEAVAGLNYELRVIASVVIGGASLAGGVGGIGGTIIGALLIGVLSNGLVMMGVNAYYQQIVIGVIIVLAVAFDTYAKKHGR